MARKRSDPNQMDLFGDYLASLPEPAAEMKPKAPKQVKDADDFSPERAKGIVLRVLGLEGDPVDRLVRSVLDAGFEDGTRIRSGSRCGKPA